MTLSIKVERKSRQQAWKIGSSILLYCPSVSVYGFPYNVILYLDFQLLPSIMANVFPYFVLTAFLQNAVVTV